MAEFSVLSGLGGGVLIGVAAVMLMGFLGRVAGISGITSSLLHPWDFEIRDWRVGFVVGLLLAPAAYYLLTGIEAVSQPSGNLLLMGAAGLLVGFGSVLGSGCTSGHGVCGLARLSPRSLVSVVTFMAVAGVVVFVTRHLLGA